MATPNTVSVFSLMTVLMPPFLEIIFLPKFYVLHAMLTPLISSESSSKIEVRCDKNNIKYLQSTNKT